MFRQTLSILIGLWVLTGCATFGTKTLYKSGSTIHPAKLGFTKLEGSSILNKIQPTTDSIFTSTFIEIFKKYGISEVLSFNKELSFENPDSKIIAQICAENNLQGLVVSHLTFINISYSLSLIPLGKTWDTEVKMKVFNSDGTLLLTVSHNTANGNSYGHAPQPQETTRDGTKGAINRIAKEFGFRK